MPSASCSLLSQLRELQLLLLLLLMMLLLLDTRTSLAALARCPNPVKNFSLAYENKDNKTDPELVSSVDDILKTDVHKACLGVVKARAALANHFLIADVNDSLVIDPGVCSQSAEQLSNLVNMSQWVVALRSSHKHMPLFEYPTIIPNVGSGEFKTAGYHEFLIWEKVDTLTFAKDFCLTDTGQLQVLRFDPQMSGTYRFLLPKNSSAADPSADEPMDSQLKRTLFHLDYIYDNEEKFEGVDIWQMPTMAPKVTKVRMHDLRNKNLRYQFRTLDRVLKPMPMDPVSSTGQKLYPKNTFDDLGIKMSWMPPPELQQFTHWKPACGIRINRDRYLRCMATVDLADIRTRLMGIIEMTKKDLNETKHKYDENSKDKAVLFDNSHAISVLYHLYVLTERMETQLKEEAVISPNQRPLYTAGFRWKENSAEGAMTLPCHYTYLHHLPWVSVKDPLSPGIRIYIPNIPNMGEREQAAMLCGISDPMELLRMLGKVLVAQLRNLVVLSTRRRPVVQQRSVVYSGKTIYMKCPVDMHFFERPACSLPKKEDNILWTLNGKTIRFFGAMVDRGASLSPSCGLTIKNIEYNDAGEYVCYRTPLGAKMVENTPAYRHFIEVTRPDFDPPPIEEVYFGLAVCFSWHGFLILLWTLVALVRSCLGLLASKDDSNVKPEVWTSFFDNDPELEGVDSDEDDDEDKETDNEGEKKAEDEALSLQSIMFGGPSMKKSRELQQQEVDRQSKKDEKNPPAPKDAKGQRVKAQPGARRRRPPGKGPARGKRRKRNASGSSPGGKRKKKQD